MDMDQDLHIGSISFGALAKAQSSLNIQELKGGHYQTSGERTGKEIPRKEHREVSHRSSKHAPTEISSKKAVSRKREAVVVPRREFRDPRFDPLTGPLDSRRTRRNYAFLESYRESEMKTLGDEIRKTKDEAVKEGLKRELLSMVNLGIPPPNPDINPDIARRNPRNKPKKPKTNSKKS